MVTDVIHVIRKNTLNLKKELLVKIRFGFVSNSSTTSFCIFGASFTPDDMKQALKILYPRPINIPTIDSLDVDEEDEDFDHYEAMKKISNALGLIFSQLGYDCDEYVLGRNYDSIKDDETGKQFKDSTKEKIEPIKPNVTVSWHEGAWRDG